MVEEEVEANVIDIERIDTIDHSDVVVIPDEVTRDDPSYTGNAIPVSNDPQQLKTGNIISQIFKLIAQARSKDFWKLENNEVASLNKTCPKILPKVITEHAGIIGCVLNLVGIIIKRLKLEAEETSSSEIPTLHDNDEIIEEEFKPLTGGRTS